MSLKYLFDERVLLCLNCVKLSNNALLHNQWCWICVREWFLQLLTRYDLSGVENTHTILGFMLVKLLRTIVITFNCSVLHSVYISFSFNFPWPIGLHLCMR
jgi:hypothetical protein